MYWDERNKRVLLSNGISIVDEDVMSKMILKGDVISPNIRVETSADSDKYLILHGVDISYDISTYEDPQPIQHINTTIDIDFSNYFRFDEIYDSYGQEAIDRLSHEITFFEQENSFLIKNLVMLIDKFKEDGIVWGVGRGSSCASLLLYVLEVHDVDPIKYDIPFSEMSKED